MTNASCPSTAAHPSAPALPGHATVKALVTGQVRSAWMQMKRMLRVAHQRRQLKRLDARLLKDVGLTREQARAEARRPFWDLP